ncbi:hypothetical protein B0J13DRAFT_392225, partial [Dactylonectria estremocensis]
MQFMSQSMGWADNVILAMAPLGIITAIVSAIRVGGPSWLKALVGRARENLAVAEADLMSSTSKEVCELWNGQEVVRCMGSAPVSEFICLLPEGMQSTTNPPAANPPATNPPATNPPATEIIIVRNVSDHAPNISLNSHNQFGRRELHVVAVIGTILQLGVLVYSGFATYYPTLKFPKDERPIADYAFPCTATGTLVLAAGMLVCAHVVESSTKEERYQPAQGKEARLVWLQQTKTVSDQDFKSFAVFAEDNRAVITTSGRADKQNKLNAFDNGILETNQGHATVLAFKAVIGTFISLSGFIVQFIGLRGMHWSASITQLGAVLVMVVLKAWVRRGLAQPPRCQPLPSEFELDWFAMTL